MKKSHLAALILIGITIAVLISSMANVTGYETIASAKQKKGKTVTVIARLDKSTVQYNPAVNPNYLTFDATDTLGDRMKVAYYYEKPYDMEKSERIVLKGKMENGVFEIRDKQGILIKCPSKYKDDPEAARKSINQQAAVKY